MFLLNYLWVIQMTSVDALSSDIDDENKTKILIQRRSIILALIGSTDVDSVFLKAILDDGYLGWVKSWIDDVLNNKIGGVDFLLHLLDNISKLPVTKDMVTSTKLGKQISSIEKHKICAGSLNENSIMERVSKVKEEWSASVKKMKKSLSYGSDDSSVSSLKRAFEPDEDDAGTKRVKTEVQDKKFSLSNLLNKNSNGEKSEEENVNDLHGNDENTSLKANDLDVKKKEKHIKWADVEIKQENATEGDKESQENVALVESKKRDRLREKELLLQARKSKLVDKDDSLDTMAIMFSGWHEPKPLPPDPENPPVVVTSKEVAVQVRRIASVLPANYLSEEYIPNNPIPLSDIELALDMTAQSSSVAESIPFYVPQQEATPPAQALPVPTPAATINQPPVGIYPSPIQPSISTAPVVNPSIATAEIVQAMGLPLFLVGQNLQALQTLAASPGLLNAFLGPNGGYDQVKIMNLVQTLTQNLAPTPARPVAQAPVTVGNMGYPAQPQPYGAQVQTQYQAPPQALGYGQNKQPMQNQGRDKQGYRGDQNLNDGNLHLSGFGPMTTPESIIALFAPYVKVEEVVPKNGFMFVNTNDPDGAKRAREALNGVLLGGQPLRINVALRRNKNQNNYDVNGFAARSRPPPRTEPVPLPRNVLGQIDYDAVRDDRGNPATKNLFVAGYGQMTTEQELRDLFNQQTQVTGVVLKGSFAFVNTAERTSAVHAREALTGAVVNGGVLRINFAKESGRLGTSFDHGYLQAANQAQTSYYGRTY